VDIGTSGSEKQFTPNNVLVSLRKSQGWGRPRLAKALDAICKSKGWASPGQAALEKQIYRLESGRIARPDDFYTRLYCIAYGKTAQELFGEIEPQTTSDSEAFGFRSHKFIPAYVGAQGYERIVESLGLTPKSGEWLECRAGNVDHPSGECELYVWPFGVAMFHLAEEREMANLAELSIWRRATYPKNRAWVDAQIKDISGLSGVSSSYVLSAYWLETPLWAGPELETAMRIMAIPRVLREDEHSGGVELEHAMLVERSLIRDGFDHPEITDFGMKGISLGYASWSGVVYHSIAPERSLAEDELVRCELAVQAAWAYCEHIREEVECGNDPAIHQDFGWRFLRGVRSRLTAERPTETTQHRSMREAIMKTSGLTKHLIQACEILRECEG
jgi:hypothetical protein